MILGIAHQIALIFALGMLGHWLAWRFKLPSILLLLILGFLAGPILHLVTPDRIPPDLLFPLVSLAVGIILFEGSTGLRFSEIQGLRSSIFLLISAGALLTWLVGAAAAHLLLGMSVPLALVLGAILTVTGPTVVGPLLQHIRPKPRVASILKWEGLLIDPVGAVLAALTLEAILTRTSYDTWLLVAAGIIQTAAAGGALGWLAGQALLVSVQRRWIPDFLHNSATLALLFASFTISNRIHAEAGLVAATVMGMVIASKPAAVTRHIVEFKENLTTLLLGSLFIVLAARIDPHQLYSLRAEQLLFVAVMIFAVRPLAVFVSTFGSELRWRERLFIAGVAPRGIVAAAVSSLFALELARAGFPDAELLASTTFVMIVATVAFYGICSLPLAQLLGVREPHPEGILFLGASKIVRHLAKTIVGFGIPVLLVDTNRDNVRLARRGKLKSIEGDLLSDHLLNRLPLEGIGRLFATTSNNEANALACLRMAQEFGEREVYQFTASASDDDEEKDLPRDLRGRRLFGEHGNLEALEELMRQGAEVTVVPIDEDQSLAKLKKEFEIFIPLMLVSGQNALSTFTAAYAPDLLPNSKLICLSKRRQ